MRRPIGHIRYANLCPKGLRDEGVIRNHVNRRRQVAYLLMKAEDENPTNVERYRAELDELKSSIDSDRGTLAQHVAHCADGCVRDTRGGLSGSAFTNAGAPAHDKPPLPSMVEIAARLREGEAVEAIAAQYDRHPTTITTRLTNAGFSARDGKPTSRPETRPVRSLGQISVLEQPWRADALCSQTDPEAFFPEQGGSPRQAKKICIECPVRQECLEWALDRGERFGIWGGLSERERRALTRKKAS